MHRTGWFADADPANVAVTSTIGARDHEKDPVERQVVPPGQVAGRLPRARQSPLKYSA